MGSILARAVLDQASILLEDRQKRRWPDSELLKWLNAGQYEIVLLRPDAKTRTFSQLLQAGTKQFIPATDLQLLDVPRNMGADGATPGRAPRHIAKTTLDNEDPTWHTHTANSVVRQWSYDKRVPYTWWCYPQQPLSNRGYVELIVSTVPTDCTVNGVDGQDSDSTIDIADIYFNPLLNFVVYRAYSKDAEYTMPGGKADLAQREFFQSLGIKTESDKQVRPEKSSAPTHEPNRPGNQGAFGDT